MKSKKNLYLAICILLLTTSIAGFIACFFIYDSKTKENKKLAGELNAINEEYTEIIRRYKNCYTQEEASALISSASANASASKEAEIKEYIKEQMTSKEGSTTKLLRAMFPECMVFKGGSNYQFVEINENIPKNPYLAEDFKVSEAGDVTYWKNGEKMSFTGIDVSQHQGNIDWKKVKEAEIDFVMIRVGFRGYGSGALVLDEQFENNISGALANNINVGIYFFSQATSELEASQEAEFVLENISKYKITYPVAIDIEMVADNAARGNNIKAEDRTNYTKIFCEEIAQRGYSPMIYGNLNSLFSMLNMEELTEYETWYANYDTLLYYPYQLKIWQYSDSAKVPGIKTKVDKNIIFK